MSYSIFILSPKAFIVDTRYTHYFLYFHPLIGFIIVTDSKFRKQFRTYVLTSYIAIAYCVRFFKIWLEGGKNRFAKRV